jgi:hypothetical protein
MIVCMKNGKDLTHETYPVRGLHHPKSAHASSTRENRDFEENGEDDYSFQPNGDRKGILRNDVRYSRVFRARLQM